MSRTGDAPPSGPLKRALRSPWVRVAAVVALLVAIGAWVARLDLRPSLAHLHVAVLSGSPDGNYHAVVERLGAAAAKKRGTIDDVPSDGSVENVQRLAAAARSCEVQFGLVQAGLPWPDGPRLSLVGRLAKAESVFFLGKHADAIDSFASLAHLRIGIGPEGSGTARVARQVLESRDFQGLDLHLTYHPVAEQLDLAEKGALDLAVLVIDEDADLVDRAVREHGLQIAGMPHADVVARRFSHLRHGRIGAGQYEPVRMLPPVDKEVLRVETLVVENGCAGRAGTLGLMAALAEVFPDFVQHNKTTPNRSGLELAPGAKSFFDNDGPELLDEVLPRLSNVMPPSNWVHLVMGISILFNAMGVANRFVLWRIDAARVKAEQRIARCFGPATTMGDIARTEAEGDLLADNVGDELTQVIRDLEQLALRSRRISVSVLVPMGGEMAYRYQEGLIHETLATLRAFLARWRAARGTASEPPSARGEARG